MRSTPQARTDADLKEVPSPSPALLAHLEEVFRPVTPAFESGLDGALNVANHVAEQRGKEAVLNYLSSLANR